MVQHFVTFMDEMPSLPLVFLYGALVGPLLVAIHEAGHAIAALWRSDGPVMVVLGSRRGLELRSGRLRIAGERLSGGAGGLCAFDASKLRAADIAMIALAGPLASLVGAAATAFLWGRAGGALHDILATATLGGVIMGVVNALPATFRSGKGADTTVLRLDGLIALEALRAGAQRAPRTARPLDIKAGPVAERWAAEVTAAAERARGMRASSNVARLRARDDERRDRSVPPPGY